MSNGWHEVTIGDVTEPADRWETPVPGTEYRQVGVRLWGEGAYERDTLDGGDTKYTSLNRAEPGDIIVNKIWARNGSVSVVSDYLSGCYCSSEFPLFKPLPNRLEPRWFYWVTKTAWFWERCDIQSRGTSGKNRIRPERFLEIGIPLPPVSEQRRIVAKIEQLASKIEEARGLQHQLFETDFAALRNTCFRAALRGKVVSGASGEGVAVFPIDEAQRLKADLEKSGFIKKQKRHPPITGDELPFDAPKGWVWARLEDITSVITDGTHWTPQYLEEGRVFLSAQNVKPYRFLPDNHKYVSEELFQACMARGKPEKGDILMTRVGAMIGETAIIDRDVEFAYYVSLCLIKPLRQVVHVPYLVHWLNSPFGTASTRQYTLGRGHSQGNLNLNLIRQFVIPMPPLEEQRRIVAYLDDLQAKVDQLKAVQAQTAAELDALLPSILDKAFRGEL